VIAVTTSPASTTFHGVLASFGSNTPEVAAVCVAGIRTVTDVGFGGHVAFGDGNWHQ
jgi:hypothetical protein